MPRFNSANRQAASNGAAKQPHEGPQSGRQTELDWTAFCYASNALSPAERDSFEQRLQREQAAREALAAAVALDGALQAAAADHCRQQRPQLQPVSTSTALALAPVWRRALIAGATVAACLALVLMPAPQQPRRQIPPTSEPDTPKDDLAMLWASQLVQLPALAAAEPADAAELEEPVALLSPPATPGWMAAALDEGPAGDLLEDSL
jgi:hypothetical protein